MAGRKTGAVPNFDKRVWTAEMGKELSEILARLSFGMNGLQGGPATPSQVQAGVDADAGVDQAVANADHVHDIETAAPSVYVAFGGSSDEGSGSALMRADARLVLSQGSTDGWGLFWASSTSAWVERAPYIQVSAGTSSGSIPDLVFSNSNGVSFGLNGSTITGSIAAPNVNFSAGTTSNNLGSVVFSNSNGVSFGLDGSTITATFVGGGNLNLSAGTTSNNLTAVTFDNAGGVSFGLNGSVVTASAPGAAPSPVNFSAGTTSGDLGSVVFSNSNGVSFGLDGSTITASISPSVGGGATISSYENNAGPMQTMTWPGAAASVSHAAAFQLPQNGSFSFIRFPVLFTQSSTGITTVASSADMSQARYWTFNAVIYSLGTGASSQSLMSVTSGSAGWTILKSASIATNGTQGSYTQAMTFQQEGSSVTRSTQYSASSTVMPISSGWFTGFTQGRLLDINFAVSLSPGPYWLIAGYTSSNASNSTRFANASVAGAWYSNHYGFSQANIAFSAFNTTGLSVGYLGGGSFSTAGGGTVAALHVTQISSSGSNNRMMFQLLRSA